MAKRCYFCDKGTVTGRSVSHAHNLTKRTWKPNVHKVRAQIEGSVRRIWVCTRCMRNGKVIKPVDRDFPPSHPVTE